MCNASIHTHTEADIAVGALEEGLLPLSQWAMRFYNRLGYHDYEGVSLDMDERERLQRSIGNHPVLVLRNHGLLATGRNVAEAFSSTYHFERSAEAQLKIQAATHPARKSSCRRPTPASGRRPNSPTAQLPASRQGSANGRPCCVSATGSTRATAPDRDSRRESPPRRLDLALPMYLARDCSGLMTARGLAAGQGARQLADRLLVLLVLDLGEVAGDFEQHALVRRRPGAASPGPAPRRNR